MKTREKKRRKRGEQEVVVPLALEISADVRGVLDGICKAEDRTIRSVVERLIRERGSKLGLCDEGRGGEG